MCRRRSGRQPLVLALGKDAKAYLLDRNNLGGIGGSLVSETVSTRPIRTAPAAYPAADGVFVAFQGQGAHCPAPRRDNNLTVLRDPRRVAALACHGMVRRFQRRGLADRHDDRRPLEPDRLDRSAPRATSDCTAIAATPESRCSTAAGPAMR